MSDQSQACGVVSISEDWQPPSSCAEKWTMTKDAGSSTTLYRQLTWLTTDTLFGVYPSVVSTSDACLPPSSTGCAFSYQYFGCIDGYAPVASSTLYLPQGSDSTLMQFVTYCCPRSVVDLFNAIWSAQSAHSSHLPK